MLPREMQVKEAIKRMNLLNIFNPTIKEFEEKFNAVVFNVIECDTEFGRLQNLLYVSENQEEWEYDIGSYIAFKQGRYARAEDILTAAMNNKNIKPGESARLNLALLYNGSSRRVQALALYRKILEDDRIDKKLQAEIYYKIAVIQREQKENRSAVLSLNQALALDPAHSRSRFMLKQLDSAAD